MSAGTSAPDLRTPDPGAPASVLIQSAREVAAGPAAEHAAEVDRAARFPAEAVRALREAGLLAAGAPRSLGGGGAGMVELVEVAEELAAGCGATGMTWAMHQIQLACLSRHGGDGLARFTRQVCQDGLLLASATSEAGVGGDIRTSRAALVPDAGSPGGYTLVKDAPTVSYGAHADAILATARRDESAAPGDQILAVLTRAATELRQTSGWDSLGMRGTCSDGFQITATVPAWAVLADPFEKIAAQTMVPYAHLLWAGCWLGIAGAAVNRARSFLRQRARRAPQGVAVAASRLAAAHGRLHLARAAVREAARGFDRRPGGTGGGLDDRWSVTVGLNDIKAGVSEAAVDVTRDALTVCGFAGYSESGPFSVARHLRDVLSGPLMVANDRLLTTNGMLLYSHRGEERPW